MSVLSWDKPKQIMSTEQWKGISADGAPPGVYQPNMSYEDQQKWKAKLIRGQLTRVEIRKTASSQVKIVVSLDGHPWSTFKDFRTKKKYPVGHKDNVVISMNGPAHFSFKQLEELREAILEAKAVLEEVTGS